MQSGSSVIIRGIYVRAEAKVIIHIVQITFVNRIVQSGVDRTREQTTAADAGEQQESQQDGRRSEWARATEAPGRGTVPRPRRGEFHAETKSHQSPAGVVHWPGRVSRSHFA